MKAKVDEVQHEGWHTCGSCSGSAYHDGCDGKCADRFPGCSGSCECPCKKPLTRDETMFLRRLMEGLAR